MSGYKELRSLSESTNGDTEKPKWLYIGLGLQYVMTILCIVDTGLFFNSYYTVGYNIIPLVTCVACAIFAVLTIILTVVTSIWGFKISSNPIYARTVEAFAVVPVMVCILIIYATSSQVPTFKNLLHTFNTCCGNLTDIPDVCDSFTKNDCKELSVFHSTCTHKGEQLGLVLLFTMFIYAIGCIGNIRIREKKLESDGEKVNLPENVKQFFTRVGIGILLLSSVGLFAFSILLLYDVKHYNHFIQPGLGILVLCISLFTFISSVLLCIVMETRFFKEYKTIIYTIIILVIFITMYFAIIFTPTQKNYQKTFKLCCNTDTHESYCSFVDSLTCTSFDAFYDRCLGIFSDLIIIFVSLNILNILILFGICQSGDPLGNPNTTLPLPKIMK